MASAQIVNQALSAKKIGEDGLDGLSTRGAPLVPCGYAQIPCADITTTHPLGAPNGATSATVQAETQALRWRDDGIAPTATVGFPLPVGQPYTFENVDLTKVTFIAQVAGAVLNVAYYATRNV